MMNYYEELKREANEVAVIGSIDELNQVFGAITFAHYAELITDEQFYELGKILRGI